MTDTSVALRFQDLEKLFFAFVGFQEGEEVRLETRLKLLRRSGVPTRDRFGRGPVAQYGLDEIFQVAIAMSLMEQMVSANEAARVIGRFWDKGLGAAPAQAWSMRAKDAVLIVLYRTTFDGFEASPTLDAWKWLPRDFSWAQEWKEGRALCIQTAGEFAKSEFFGAHANEPLPFGRYHASVINCSKLVDAVLNLLLTLELASQAQIDLWFAEQMRGQSTGKANEDSNRCVS